MSKILHFDNAAISQMEQRFRANFINSITGFKSANLIGTIGKDNHTNLAVFSSVLHLGSHPPLLGFITRPNSVARHTYENIKNTHVFTVNHIHTEIINKAHQTAARYDATVSEFDATGLHTYFQEKFVAPFVKEAHIKIACQYVNEYSIKENGTILVVGAMQDIYIPEGIHSDDGWIDLSAANTVTVNGLDSYSKPVLIDRLSYAKPDRIVTSILKK